MENFSARLREIRGDLSKNQAAARAGIKQQNWTRYENGQVLPGAEAIRQICVAFGVSADWLLGLADNQPRNGTNELKVAALKGAIQAILDKF